MTLLEKAKKARDMFEYHEETKDERGNTTRDSFWSFTMQAIDKEGGVYRTMSDCIHGAEMDEDSAYTFTVEAIETIIEHLEGLTQEEQDAIDLEEYAYEKEAPIYYYDLLQWFSKGTSNAGYTEEAINELGWTKDTSLMSMIAEGYLRAWAHQYNFVLRELQELK